MFQTFSAVSKTVHVHPFKTWLATITVIKTFTGQLCTPVFSKSSNRRGFSELHKKYLFYVCNSTAPAINPAKFSFLQSDRLWLPAEHIGSANKHFHLFSCCITSWLSYFTIFAVSKGNSANWGAGFCHLRQLSSYCVSLLTLINLWQSSC